MREGILGIALHGALGLSNRFSKRFFLKIRLRYLFNKNKKYNCKNTFKAAIPVAPVAKSGKRDFQIESVIQRVKH